MSGSTPPPARARPTGTPRGRRAACTLSTRASGAIPVTPEGAATCPQGALLRAAVASAARTVVKVGSSSLTAHGQLDPRRLDAIVDALAARHAGGRQVVLVSSGAIAAGLGPL